MTDIESQVFTAIYDAVTAVYADCNIVGEMITEPAVFPAVSVEEIRNVSYVRTMDSSGERHSKISYEINIYTNDTTQKKTKAKDILAIIDNIMLGLNFQRATSRPYYTHNTQIYRIVARYNAVVDNSQTLYRG